MQARVPENEAERLAALRRYRILDTLPEQDFDDLALLASQVCATPMAVVSLVDAERQWFKAKVGVTATRTSREIAFCAHAILQSDLLVVPDALADERFASNPLVTAEPHIRFYAGAPLITADGYTLGTLCVMDCVPRHLTEGHARALRALGKQVVRQLEFRRVRDDLTQTITESQAVEQALRESEEFKTQLIETSEDCIKVLDLEGRLLSMNAGGMRRLEICDFAPLRNAQWVEFWKGEHHQAALAALATAKQGGVGRFIGFCPTMGGKPMWWDVILSPIHDTAGRVNKLLAVSREVTERIEAERRLRAIVEGTANATGKDFFRSMVQHMAAALPVKVAFVTECANAEKTRARTLAFWNGVGFGEDVEYDVEATPCRKVFEGETCFYSRELQKLFPADRDLVDLQAQSYIGLPMHDSHGSVIGHLAVLDDEPMDQGPRGLDVLKIFASRAGAELERMKAEAELREAFAEIEKLKNRLHAENIYLQEEIRREHNFEEIVGSSPALHNVLQQVERVAPTDASVLIFGETGTGKELIARAIHNRSTRQARPLVKVNCGAISAGLVESELFGHVKGAFTGAFERRTGRFELADGGTLFLDEVGELPLETQVKLLRVLQEGEFEPVGSSRTVRVDVRIIAATNRHLEEAVQAGRFRSDLFYRLNVFPIRVPALRERRSDIPQLVLFFLSRAGRKFGKRIEGVSQETMELFVNYSWPGNVRELQNLIERAVVLSEGPILTLSQNLFPASSFGEGLTAQASAVAPAAVLPSAATAASAPATRAPFSLEEIERQHILSVLEQTRWIIEGPQGAAKLLHLHPNTLRGRMKKLGIQRPS
jgi:PAS domain S-box-containing protein